MPSTPTDCDRSLRCWLGQISAPASLFSNALILPVPGRLGWRLSRVDMRPSQLRAPCALSRTSIEHGLGHGCILQVRSRGRAASVVTPSRSKPVNDRTSSRATQVNASTSVIPRAGDYSVERQLVVVVAAVGVNPMVFAELHSSSCWSLTAARSPAAASPSIMRWYWFLTSPSITPALRSSLSHSSKR